MFIPETITEIGAGAFSDSRNLTTVTFEEGSTPSFGDGGDMNATYTGVFANCPALASITLPAGTEKLGEYMFDSDSTLAKVNLSELTKITEIPVGAFR